MKKMMMGIIAYVSILIITTVLSNALLLEPVTNQEGGFYCSRKGQAEVYLPQVPNPLDKMMAGGLPLWDSEQWKLINDDGVEWAYHETQPWPYDWMIFRFIRPISTDYDQTYCYWNAFSISSSNIKIYRYIFNGDHSHWSFNFIDSGSSDIVYNFRVYDYWWRELGGPDEDIFFLVTAHTPTGDGIPEGDLDWLLCDVMTVHVEEWPVIKNSGNGTCGNGNEGIDKDLITERDSFETGIKSSSLGEIKATFR